jgi:hypothetical protein
MVLEMQARKEEVRARSCTAPGELVPGLVHESFDDFDGRSANAEQKADLVMSGQITTVRPGLKCLGMNCVDFNCLFRAARKNLPAAAEIIKVIIVISTAA